MAKRIITGDTEQREPKLVRQVNPTDLMASEVDVVKTLNSTKKGEVEQACLDDLAFIERKYKKKLKEPQWQTPEGKAKLDRMVQRFKKRRYDILASIGIKKQDLEVRID